MKRHNLYLYKCNENNQCKSVGFCRIDIYGSNNIRVSISLNKKLLGICQQNVDICPEILLESGNVQRFSCNNSSESLFDYTGCTECDNVEEIVGIVVVVQRDEGLQIELKGMLDGRSVGRRLVKLKYEKLTDLPRRYWHLSRNKFFMCGCNRYGHFAYIKNGEDYIICVPGNNDEHTAKCARKYGFPTYWEENKGAKEVYFLCQENRK